MRRAVVESHFSTKLFPIAGQRWEREFLCLRVGWVPVVPGLVGQWFAQLTDRSTRPYRRGCSTLLGKHLSCPMTDIQVFFCYSYYGAVDESKFMVSFKIKHSCLA